MQAVTYRTANSYRGMLFIAMTAFLWGTVGVASKGIHEAAYTNALSLSFFRLALSTPVFLLACRHLVGPRMLAIERRDLWIVMVMGVSLAIHQITYFAAVEALGVMVAVLVAICSAPVVVALLSALLLGERMTHRVLLALVCALGGTALLVAQPDTASVKPITFGGVLLALAAGSSYAVVALCSRSLAGNYHPLQPISIAFVLGTILVLPFVLFTGGGLALSYPPQGWLLLLYIGMLPTALAYLLFVSGLRTTTATVASIITLLEPLTSTVLAWFIFREQLGPRGVQGAILLLAAMMLLLWQPSRPRQAGV
jgi:drug/metabolite transporter, DME family